MALPGEFVDIQETNVVQNKNCASIFSLWLTLAF